MPDPVSATSISAWPCRCRSIIDSQPPFGIASRAFRNRLRNTCCSLYSMPSTIGASARDPSDLDVARSELMLEQRQHVVDDGVDVDGTWLDLRRPREVQQTIDDLGGAERLPLDLLEQLRASDPPCRRSAAASA